MRGCIPSFCNELLASLFQRQHTIPTEYRHKPGAPRGHPHKALGDTPSILRGPEPFRAARLALDRGSDNFSALPGVSFASASIAKLVRHAAMSFSQTQGRLEGAGDKRLTRRVRGDQMVKDVGRQLTSSRG